MNASSKLLNNYCCRRVVSKTSTVCVTVVLSMVPNFSVVYFLSAGGEMGKHVLANS